METTRRLTETGEEEEAEKMMIKRDREEGDKKREEKNGVKTRWKRER